jgi:hypothetical protein
MNGQQPLVDWDSPTLSVEDAGKCFGLSRGSAYEAVRSEQIPSIRIGKRLVVPTAEVKRLLGMDSSSTSSEHEQHQQPPPPRQRRKISGSTHYATSLTERLVGCRCGHVGLVQDWDRHRDGADA